MKTTIFTILFAILAFYVSANDGVYVTSGGTIYPTQETSISIQKEMLSFTVRDEVAYVAIQFEFFNPENTERKLLVGFQAPTGAGDMPDSLCNSPQIKDFVIMQEGKILPYTLKAAECENCALKETSDITFTAYEQGIFVYL
ncbi:MAG: hypothetical protein AAF740_10025, partial [Bacteroidota bacterium]